MVSRACLAIALLAAAAAPAQDTASWRGAGLLRASAAISPGFMLDAPATDIYLNGKLEYFLEDRLSFRGEAFWYVDSQQDPAPLAQNSQLGFGPFLHLGRGRGDLALGFEAGLSLVQPALPVAEGAATGVNPLRTVPSAALCAGFTYTIWDYFHFFLDARLVHARYTGAASGTIPLDEAIISGGLGWQLRLRR